MRRLICGIRITQVKGAVDEGGGTFESAVAGGVLGNHKAKRGRSFTALTRPSRWDDGASFVPDAETAVVGTFCVYI